MKIYYAHTPMLDGLGLPKIGILRSYALLKADQPVVPPDYCDLFFLDSGAFSVWRRGLQINLVKYIQFIQANLESLAVYAALDVVNKPAESLVNYGVMVQAGLNPLPTIHLGTPLDWIERYLGMGATYIGLGGMAMTPRERRRPWLAEVFSKYPDVRFHGFGMMDGTLLAEFPFYSVDGTGLLRTATCGSLRLPGVKNLMIGERVSNTRSAARWATPQVLQELEQWCTDRGMDFQVCRQSDTEGSRQRLKLMVLAFEEFANTGRLFTQKVPEQPTIGRKFLL